MRSVFVAEHYNNLWRSVVTQTMREALEFDRPALEWFLVPPRADLTMICDLSDQDVDYISTRVSVWLLANATVISNNECAVYDKDRDRIIWRTPHEATRKYAQWFLQSDYAELARQYAGPRFDPARAKEIVIKSLTAARGI